MQYDPASLQYMLDFFRGVAQSIPTDTSASASQDGDAIPIEPLGGGPRDDSSKRAGIIVLREDLDFYAIPPRPDIGQAEMIEVKRAAAKALLKQDGIFSGLKRSDEPGTTEAHLIEMLTAGFVYSSLLSTHQLLALRDMLTRMAAASTTTTDGATARASPTRRWCAALRWRGCAATYEATRWAITPWGWRRSCCCSGGSRRGGAGGREWS
jgi:hypothetical protein